MPVELGKGGLGVIFSFFLSLEFEANSLFWMFDIEHLSVWKTMVFQFGDAQYVGLLNCIVIWFRSFLGVKGVT